jgi:hypothetical protein
MECYNKKKVTCEVQRTLHKYLDYKHLSFCLFIYLYIYIWGMDANPYHHCTNCRYLMFSAYSDIMIIQCNAFGNMLLYIDLKLT